MNEIGYDAALNHLSFSLSRMYTDKYRRETDRNNQRIAESIERQRQIKEEYRENLPEFKTEEERKEHRRKELEEFKRGQKAIHSEIRENGRTRWW